MRITQVGTKIWKQGKNSWVVTLSSQTRKRLERAGFGLGDEIDRVIKVSDNELKNGRKNS